MQSPTLTKTVACIYGVHLDKHWNSPPGKSALPFVNPGSPGWESRYSGGFDHSNNLVEPDHRTCCYRRPSCRSERVHCSVGSPCCNRKRSGGHHCPKTPLCSDLCRSTGHVQRSIRAGTACDGISRGYYRNRRCLRPWDRYIEGSSDHHNPKDLDRRQAKSGPPAYTVPTNCGTTGRCCSFGRSLHPLLVRGRPAAGNAPNLPGWWLPFS